MSGRRGVIYSDEQLEALWQQAARDADANRAEPEGAAYGEATARMLYWAAVQDDKPVPEVERLKQEWEQEKLRLRWEQGREARGE